MHPAKHILELYLKCDAPGVTLVHLRQATTTFRPFYDVSTHSCSKHWKLGLKILEICLNTRTVIKLRDHLDPFDHLQVPLPEISASPAA